MTPDVPRLQADVERTLAEDDADAHIECTWCGMSSRDVGSDRVVEHALFDHVVRAGLIIVRAAELFDAYELALAAGLPACTEHEEEWRKKQGCVTPGSE